MSDVPAILDRLGGYAKVAEAIRAPIGTVAAWRHRKSIPVRYWPAIVATAPAEGKQPVTAGELVAAHAPAPRPTPESARAVG